MENSFTLAKGAMRVALPNRQRRTAFTLAEVLITLGIIGVVAALTLPAIILDYQKKQTVTQLKQTYSLISQAIKLSEIDNGPMEYWSLTDSKYFSEQYIKPYFKIVKTFDSLLPANYHIYCNSSKRGICDSYGAANNALSSKFILENGVLLIIAATNGNGYMGMTIIVDLNGLKAPNRYGRDVFMFTVDYEKGFVPYGMGLVAGVGYQDVKRDDLLKGYNSRACIKDGLFCAAVILMDGWDIKDDYPW